MTGTKQFRTGWLLFVVLIVFTLSIGTAVHNHGIAGSDGGAEKISQSKFTCPACVFDGKPVMFAETAIVTWEAYRLTITPEVEVSFDTMLGECSASRAPPAA